MEKLEERIKELDEYMVHISLKLAFLEGVVLGLIKDPHVKQNIEDVIKNREDSYERKRKNK